MVDEWAACQTARAEGHQLPENGIEQSRMFVTCSTRAAQVFIPTFRVSSSTVFPWILELSFI